MILLNEDQISYIAKILEEQGLKNDSFREELLDHLCCQIEHSMNKGTLFQQAIDNSISAFQEDEMAELQKRISKSSNPIQSTMIKVSLVAISAFFTLLIITDSDHPNDEIPMMDHSAIVDLHEVLIDPPTISPLKGERKITSGFGMRMHPVFKERKKHWPNIIWPLLPTYLPTTRSL